MGGFARRRIVSASLRRLAAGRGSMGQAAASRDRPTAHLSGAYAVIGLLESLARPLLRMLDAEDAHRLAINALKIPPFVKLVAEDPRLAVRAFGLNFPNPVGMAAGFDKNAGGPDALLRLGFGFVEIGSGTPPPPE